MDLSTQSGAAYALLKAKRDELIAMWGASIKGTVAPDSLPRAELFDSMPAFVDEVIAALNPQALPLPPGSANAFQHGAQRLRLGFDVAEVVREYGLLHECVLRLSREGGVALTSRDQQVLAHALNTGIAYSAEEYVKRRDKELERQASQHIGFVAHELRNLLTTALLALRRLRRTPLPEGTGSIDVLERNLRRTTEMINDALSEASFKMGIDVKREPIALEPFLHTISADWDLEARARHIEMMVSVADDVTVEADKRLLRSAISNLVYNALKFSRPASLVALTASRVGDEVLIDVADACGGLPPGKAEELFTPSVQKGNDRSGFGFGLAIAQQAVEAHQGSLHVRDVPGTGCVFSIQLPAAPTNTASAEASAY